MSRKRLAFILIPIGFVLLVVLTLPFVVDVNRYRGQIEETVSARLGRRVTLGPMRISIVPLGLRIRDLSIAEDQRLDTGRPFVRVSTFAMANLVAGKRVVPELIQDDFTPERVAAEAIDILTNAARAARMREDLRAVRERLGTAGASDRAARAVIDVARHGRATALR